MDILYIRVSSILQNTERQKSFEKQFKLVVEDRCSGSIPFKDRHGGHRILGLLKSKSLTSLNVSSIDRLGRNLRDLLWIIDIFNEYKVPINFISQGLRTLDDNGKENAISNMVIGILGIVAEMEREQARERQAEGIAVAKAKGRFLGRKSGTKEDVLTFLSKPKHKKALTYLKKGTLKNKEVAILSGVHINTITKIKKLGLPDENKI